MGVLVFLSVENEQYWGWKNMFCLGLQKIMDHIMNYY